MNNVREYSNGESAFLYFTEKIGEDGLYLLDEPENSLSQKRQMELVNFLGELAILFWMSIYYIYPLTFSSFNERS